MGSSEHGERGKDRPGRVDIDRLSDYRIGAMSKSVAQLVWLLVGLVVIVAPLAWATPLDPSWTKGMYDEGDFDDLLAYLTSGSAATYPAPVTDGSPVPTREVTVLLAPDLVVSGASGPSTAPRGPPIA